MTLLRFSLRNEPIGLPILSDQYIINDIIYHLVSHKLKFKHEIEDRIDITDTEIYELLDANLAHEDCSEMLLIKSAIEKRVEQITSLEMFEFLNHRKGIEDVYYRFEHSERYVRFYVQLTGRGESSGESEFDDTVSG